MTTKIVTFWFSIGIGILWCTVLLQTRNTLWFFVPATVSLIIWLIYARENIRYYLHPKALQANSNGIKCMHLNQYEKARLFFDEAIRLYPRNPWALSNRGLINIYLGAIDEAISDAEKAIKYSKNFSNPYTVKALAQVRKRNYEYALKECETAINISPKDSFSYLVRGEVYASKSEYDLAIQNYQRALELVNQKRKRQQATIYTDLSLAYWLKGDQEQTLRILEKAIELSPKFAIPYSYRAFIQCCIGDFNEALADVKRALALSPLFCHAYSTRGQIYFQQDQYIDSLADFQKSEELKPNDKFALAGQAICFYKLGQRDDAKRTWQLLIKIDPAYIGIAALVNDYRPAQQFVETAKQLIAELVTDKGEQ